MTTPQKKKRKLRKETRILALVIVVLIALIIGLVVYQIVSERSGSDEIVIVVDNAHGGDSSGLQGIISEDEYNEKVIDALYAKLENDSKFTVVRTHADGQAMAVSTRVEVINDARADLVLSVRCHDFMNSAVTSPMIYVQPPVNSNHKTSAEFAGMLAKQFEDKQISATTAYFYNHPIKAGYYQEHIVGIDDESDYGEETFELMSANAPVVIVSQLNVNAQEEIDTWANEEGYEAIANIYYKAIQDMYR